MKFLLFAVTLYVLFWLVRRSLRDWKRPRTPSAGTRAGAPAEPQPMLSCAECGLHLPRDEALPGRGGVFCGAPHRAAFERAHPDST